MAKAKSTKASDAGVMTRREAGELFGQWPSVDSPDAHFPREITDDKRLGDAVAWVTWRDLQRKAVADRLKERVAELQKDAAEFLALSGCDHPRFDEAEAAAQAYIRKNRRRLLADRKTVQLSGGFVKVRTAAASLCPTHRHDDASVLALIDRETGAMAAVNAALESVGARPWLRATLSLDKVGVKAAVERGEVGSDELSKRFLRIEQPETMTLSRAA